MVWLKAKEKFHGRNLPGTHCRRYASEGAARLDVAKWNSLNPKSDKLTIVSFHKTKPSCKAARKTRRTKARPRKKARNIFGF